MNTQRKAASLLRQAHALLGALECEAVLEADEEVRSRARLAAIHTAQAIGALT